MKVEIPKQIAFDFLKIKLEKIWNHNKKALRKDTNKKENKLKGKAKDTRTLEQNVKGSKKGN